MHHVEGSRPHGNRLLAPLDQPLCARTGDPPKLVYEGGEGGASPSRVGSGSAGSAHMSSRAASVGQLD